MTEKIKVLIVDDEAPARMQLRHYIDNDPRFEVMGEADNGPKALELINEQKPDLLLLDIQMPGMTGFDVLRLLEGTPPPVIFTTAYDQYAVKAFEVSAIDYVVKPISEERFKTALDKLAGIANHDWQTKIQTILDKLSDPEDKDNTDYIQRLPVRHLKKVHLVPVEDISHIVSENRLVHVYDKDGNRYWTGETLSQLEGRLNPDIFFRIHRSSIINVTLKLEIEPWEDGRLRVHLGNDTTLVVSRTQANKLKKILNI